jgi:hypothetical protein
LPRANKSNRAVVSWREFAAHEECKGRARDFPQARRVCLVWVAEDADALGLNGRKILVGIEPLSQRPEPLENGSAKAKLLQLRLVCLPGPSKVTKVRSESLDPPQTHPVDQMER